MEGGTFASTEMRWLKCRADSEKKLVGELLALKTQLLVGSKIYAFRIKKWMPFRWRRNKNLWVECAQWIFFTRVRMSKVRSKTTRYNLNCKHLRVVLKINSGVLSVELHDWMTKHGDCVFLIIEKGEFFGYPKKSKIPKRNQILTINYLTNFWPRWSNW